MKGLACIFLALSLGDAFRLTAAPSPAVRAPLRRIATVMQAEPPPAQSESEQPLAPAESEGYATFYDDEKEDEVLQAKPQLSNTMRERLIKEQRGLGADPNAGNPFLLVFGGVGVFVILGALAVNM